MKKNKVSPIVYMIILFIFGIIILFLSLIISNGVFLNKIVYDFSYFVDFFDHIRRFYLGLNSVYSEGMHASFPPLAYCFYYLIARILYFNNVQNPDGLPVSGSGLLIICILTSIQAILFIFAFFRLCQLQSMSIKKMMAFLLFCSYPFWLAIERGNLSFFVLIILMYAIALKNSSKKVEREGAMFLFAIAAALKLYPAIFGILYISEKRYKEAIRLIIYGCIFFFLPFMFFDGFNGLQAFLHNITAVNSGATGVTIVGIIGRIGAKLGMDLQVAHRIGKLVSYLFCAIVIAICFINKETWKTIALVTSLMIIFVAASGTYCLIYCVIPLVSFMNYLCHKEYFTNMDYVYTTLFTFVFIAYPCKYLGSSGTLYITLYILLGVLIVDQSINMYKVIRKGEDGSLIYNEIKKK